MNKFLTKIAGVVASLAMVIGVGVGVASKQAKGAYADVVSGSFVMFTGELVEGDYVVSNGTTKAMANTTANTRICATGITVTNNTISNPSDSIVWHIAPSGNYWTIYNSAVSQYAASTGAKNKAQLLASGTDDMSLWACSSNANSTKYDFVNKKNTDNSVNATLRYNSQNADNAGPFAAYSTSTGTALTLYKKDTSGGQQPASTVQSVTINNAPQSTVTGVNVGSNGPTLTATATMRSGEDTPTFTWASDNENAVTVNVSTGALQYVGNGTAHITATASLPAGDQDGDTNVGTVTITTSNLKGSDTNPLTVSEALVIAEAAGETETTQAFHTSGVVSRVRDEEYNSSYGNKTFWISADGSASNELEAYRCLYLDGEKMSEAEFNSVEAGDSVTIVGKLVTYNSTKEYAQGCYITSHAKPVLPRVSITEPSQSIDAGETLNLHATVENAVPNYSIAWESGNNNILTVESTGLLTATVTAGNNGGSTTVTAKMLDEDSDVVATSAAITITVTVPLLSNGDTVIFFYSSNYLTDINTSGSTHYGNRTTTKADAVVYTVEAGSAEGSFAFVTDESYLCWNSGNSLDYSNSITSNSSWNVSGTSLTNCSIENVNTSSRSLRYNSGATRFACYDNGQQPVSIEKVTAPQINSVSASLEDKTYYEGDKLSAEDFALTVTWTEGKADTHPTSNFTWTVNGVEDGDLANGNNTIVVTYSGVQSDSFQVSAVAKTPSMYLNNAESFATISGDEISSARRLVFEELGLDNGASCDEETYDIDDAATITFSGGTTKAKYYDTGTAVRIYAGGKFVIESKTESNINKITLAWDTSESGHTPTANDVVDVGSFDKTTNIWTGSAKKITFTRPTGSGHWRLQSVRVVCGEDTITVNNLTLRFGVSIPVSDWESINNNANWEITDYGVMMYKTKAQFATTSPAPMDLYNINPAYVRVMSKGSGVAPTARDGKYNFSGRVEFTDGVTDDYDMYMCAQAFIVVNGTDYYSVGQVMKKTVRMLAASNDGTNLSNDALATLLA